MAAAEAGPIECPFLPLMEADPPLRRQFFTHPSDLASSALRFAFASAVLPARQKSLEDHPHWSDEDLFHKARLINSALMAKIHTVDWTPAILPHPTTAVGVPSNWWGLAGEEKLNARLGKIRRIAPPGYPEGDRHRRTNPSLRGPVHESNPTQLPVPALLATRQQRISEQRSYRATR